MKANFFRATLAATCAVTMLGGVALAGSASAAIQGERTFSYRSTMGGPVQFVTLEAMCAYYTSEEVYESILNGDDTDRVFPTLESRNDIEIVVGTDGDDVINGGSGDQMILAFGGSDVINGGSGDDYVCGGGGADVINLGSGDDEAFGGMGGDTITGGSDHDRMFGDGGQDSLSDGSGDDFVRGGGGNDTATVGSGSNDINLGADE